MSSERIIQLDMLKGIAILLAVLGHVVDGFSATSEMYRWLFFSIYLIHMPIFIVVAGLLDNDARGGVGPRTASYLALYILTRIVFLVGDKVAGNALTFNFFGDSSPAWFMLAMAAWSPLAHATSRISLPPLLVFWVALSCAVGYDGRVGDWLCLSRIIVFFPFYLVGYRLDPLRVTEFFRKRPWILIGIIGLVLGLYVIHERIQYFYSYRGMLTGRNAYELILAEGCGATERFVWYVVVFTGLALCFGAICSLSCRPLAWFGRRSLSIYVFHSPILTILGKMGVLNSLRVLPGGVLLLAGLSVAVGFACAAPPLCALLRWFQRTFSKVSLHSAARR